MTDPERCSPFEQLVDECTELIPYLSKLSEQALPAWLYNTWLEVLDKADRALNDGSLRHD